MDMNTGTYVAGAIESSIINAGIAQMAQYYDLPLYATGGQSDAKLNDAQAGYESACQAMTLDCPERTGFMMRRGFGELHLVSYENGY